MLSIYQKNEDLIAIGAYKKGSNPALDEAVEKIGRIQSFLMQEIEECFSYEDTVSQIIAIVGT